MREKRKRRRDICLKNEMYKKKKMKKRIRRYKGVRK